MTKAKIILIAIIAVIIIFVFMIYFSAQDILKKELSENPQAVNTVTAGKQPAAGNEPGYSAPVNSIPAPREIEEQIKRSKEKNSEAERLMSKLEQEYVMQKQGIGSGAAEEAVPQKEGIKKAVTLPTPQEQEDMKSRGIVTY